MQNPFDSIIEDFNNDDLDLLRCKACGSVIWSDMYRYHFRTYREHVKECKGLGAILEVDRLIREELTPFLNRILLSLDQV